jgi:hypothetical protein
MKKSLTVLLCLLAFGSMVAQEPETTTNQTPAGTVEKSIFNLQTGAIGIWGSNELGLSNRWALRSEVGFDLWYYDNFWTGESGSVLVPGVSVEPRWYYNIARRARKGRHTENNSASFVTLAVKFYPDLFLIGNAPDNLYVPNQMTFIPKWGIRRAIAKSNFNYELAFGIGYLLMLDSDDFIKSPTDDVGVDIHIRLGYTF